jgi:hypothetical protein
MARHFLVEFLIVTTIVVHVPFCSASSEAQDDLYPSQADARGVGRKVSVPETTIFDDAKDNVHPIKKKDPNTFQPFSPNHERSMPWNGNIDGMPSRGMDFTIDSGVVSRRAQLSTEKTTAQANLIIDKTSYYDGEQVIVTYEVQEETTTEWPFSSWIALFPDDIVDYTQTQPWDTTNTWYGIPSGTVELTTRLLPALGKYKAVMAISDTDPLHILGVSDSFDVLQNTAVLGTDEPQYYEGETIDVAYYIAQWDINVPAWFAWTRLFPEDVVDYSVAPVGLSINPYVYNNPDTFQLSTRNLPVLNARYKAVMAIADSSPLRILGVSNVFEVLQNSATLETEETQYYEGEMIDVTYTMSEDADNMEWGFAWVAFFAKDVSDYSLTSPDSQQSVYWRSGNTGTVQFSSRNLPLDSKFKAVMAITDSSPLRILGVSNTFEVVQNSANLTTDQTQYYEGRTIHITYTMSQDVDNLEYDFARVALFAEDVSEYSLTSAISQNSVYWASGSTGLMQLSSRNLPLDSKCKAVMFIADSNPLRILGVSSSFQVLQNYAALVTDETQYYEGETIDVTYAMSQDAFNMEYDFAWVALFADNVSDYSLSTPALLLSVAWRGTSTGTMQFSSRNLQLDSQYKAVMAITDSSPLRILGVSNSFEIITNSAILTTDETLYYEGETIDVTYTMSQDADNMEYGFAWVGLFADNVSDYSLTPPVSQLSVNSRSGSNATMQFPSRNLPLNSQYRAVMAITDSSPLRILGVSDSFEVIQNFALLTTDETQYYEGETIDVTYVMSQSADNMEYDFAWVALFTEDVSDYSLAPATQSSVFWRSDSTATIQFSSGYLPPNAKYKAVMAITDSSPLRILGVSNTFEVLQNSGNVTTDEPLYYEGEVIDVTLTMRHDSDNMVLNYAWVALFADNVSDYSLTPAIESWIYWRSDISTTTQFSSRNLPLDSKYKAVVAIAYSNPRRILGVSNPFEVVPNAAILTTDETQYYEGETVDVTYTLSQGSDNMEWGFAWVAFFDHNVSDYSLTPAALQSTWYWNSGNSGTMQFSSRNLPALNATYKAVMAIADSNPPRILGVSNTFTVLQSTAELVTDETQYYEGEKIEVTYVMSQDVDNLEWGFAWVGLLAGAVSDYSLSPLTYVHWSGGNIGTVELSSRNLPSLNVTYKAVMAITNSYPLRILGVSNTFFVLRNYANLSADEAQYYEGETIDVTYTMSEDADNMEWAFAWVALYAHNVSDYYATSPVTYQYVGYTMRDHTATVHFSSINLPLDSKYKAVMIISGSSPPRILGVSNTFDVLQNTANLTTDETQYYEGETIEVAFAMSPGTDNMEWGFAAVALFAEDVSDYSLTPPVSQSWMHSSNGNSGTVQFSSINLPLSTQYKAVMVVTSSWPRRVLGVSNSFEVLQNSATLATDEALYYEGETIDVTYTMSQDADDMEYGFAWVALFADTVSDYSLTPPAIQLSVRWRSGSNATMNFPSRNLPLDSKYKAVMAISYSSPLRILGVSDAFEVVQNSAALVTDEVQYYEGELIDVTYRMSEEADNMEYGFAWVGLFADNVTDYSLTPPVVQSLVYWTSGYTGTVQLPSRNLPLESQFKAVMAIADSSPLRILGESNSFEVIQNFAELMTDEVQYYEGEAINVTYVMNQDADNMDWGFAWVGLFADHVSDYSLTPPLSQSSVYWRSGNNGTIQLSSINLPLDSQYKAVMAITDSSPLRILGVSNSFEIVQNFAILTTDEMLYYEGETIDVNYTMSEGSDNMEWGFAWVGLFADNVSDYSLTPPLSQSWVYWSSGNNGTIPLSSRHLQLDAQYKAVMAISGSSPLRVLGVSNSFEVIQNFAVLMTDETLYYEGEMIDITYTMSQDADNMEYGFAWVGLFADYVSDYSLTPPLSQSSVYWRSGSNATMQFSIDELPLDSKYRAVMAISGSSPLRILGISSSFEVKSGLRSTTRTPTTQPTTLSPTKQPTTNSPTNQPTTLSPTKQPTTLSPTKEPTTLAPTKQPTTLAPTKQPTTLAPTKQPTTLAPTKQPTTLAPTKQPTTLAPTKQPTTLAPTKQPTTLPPTKQPTTLSPTRAPTRRQTTKSPTRSPTKQPTKRPTSKSPTRSPTKRPTKRPTSKSPTRAPTRRPTKRQTSKSPTRAPTRRPTL